MIVILKSGATDEQIEHVIERIEQLGHSAHLSRGTHRTIIGVIGDEESLRSEPLKALPGVADVIPVLPPYKLVSREAHPDATIVHVGSVPVGGGYLAMIAGPCAVESEERMVRIARAVRRAGANILRGGAFKPRTSPYSFQGLGTKGLEFLRTAGDEAGMPVVTEATDPRLVETICRYADMLQVGARNMQNFVLLREVGQTDKPVLLKRGMSATVSEWLMSAEYIASQGNSQVILCERGIRGFDSATRNVFDVAAIPLARQLTHLPVIADPSHATGRPDLIPSCALAAMAAGADGVHVEVHDEPEQARSDGAQALLPDQYEELFQQMSRLAELYQRRIAGPGDSSGPV